MSEFCPDWKKQHDYTDDHNDLSDADRWRVVQERVRLLHIYGQWSWHSGALILGNRNALIVLRDAIQAVLDIGGSASTGATTADGEGYTVDVTMQNEPWEHPAWETADLPYSDPRARGQPDPWSDARLLRYALRQANAQLVKRGVKPVQDPTADQDAEART